MRKNIIYTVVIIAIVGLMIYGFGGKKGEPRVPLEGFASCLTEKGAVFYGAFWCSHCKDQKDAFGSAADLLPYVECSTPDGRGQVAACAEKDIKGYPTWIFADGSRESGELPLERLAEKTGCVLPQ